jgi:4-oxalocrotonate tautomerase
VLRQNACCAWAVARQVRLGLAGPHGVLPLAFAFIIGSTDLHLSGETMPTYHVEMLEGRTLEQKKKLVEAITRVSVEVLGGQAESVDVLITDVKRENWATGGKLWSEPRS